MARDSTIEARLWRWAEAVKGGADVHGYPVKCTLHPDWSPPSPGMTPTLKVAPASDVRQTHALVLQLSERMQATLSAHYVYRMSMAMAGEMLEIANLGVEFLRMDAVAFVWKRMGTPCENLPEAHTVIRAFSALVRIAAPAMLFKSEAIVHPDEVVKYISPEECQIS